MLRLGRDVGVTDGEQGARILPASFAVNERAGRLDVLDTPNARIASFDLNGRPTGVTPIGTRTASDIVRLPDGTREVLDAVRGRLIDADTSSVRSDTSLRDRALRTRSGAR
jgi:hypothetical protein